jgi:hypothetical protein
MAVVVSAAPSAAWSTVKTETGPMFIETLKNPEAGGLNQMLVTCMNQRPAVVFFMPRNPTKGVIYQVNEEDTTEYQGEIERKGPNDKYASITLSEAASSELLFWIRKSVSEAAAAGAAGAAVSLWRFSATPRGEGQEVRVSEMVRLFDKAYPKCPIATPIGD